MDVWPVLYQNQIIDRLDKGLLAKTRHDGEGSTESSSELLNSLDAVEVCLRAHTLFILSGFRR